MTEIDQEPVAGENPDFSLREAFESMNPDQLTDHILELAERASLITQEMNLAADVLEGGYGTSIQEVLQKRFSPNSRGLHYTGLFDRNGNGQQ